MEYFIIKETFEKQTWKNKLNIYLVGFTMFLLYPFIAVAYLIVYLLTNYLELMGIRYEYEIYYDCHKIQTIQNPILWKKTIDADLWMQLYESNEFDFPDLKKNDTPFEMFKLISEPDIENLSNYIFIEELGNESKECTDGYFCFKVNRKGKGIDLCLIPQEGNILKTIINLEPLVWDVEQKNEEIIVTTFENGNKTIVLSKTPPDRFL